MEEASFGLYVKDRQYLDKGRYITQRDCQENIWMLAEESGLIPERVCRL